MILASAFRRNPYPVYALLRRIAPVFHDRRHGVWLLFDDATVRAVLSDPVTFSSQAAPPGARPMDWLIFLDPPLHTKMRAIVMSTFQPRAIAALESTIAQRVSLLLESATAGGTMDLVSDFAERLPIMVIADMIGLPETDERLLRRWADAILGLGDTLLGGEAAARARQDFAAAQDEMEPYVAAAVASRRSEPRDDLLSRLVSAEVDGERLAQHDILRFFQLLLLAGSETTTNLISNAVLTLIQHPPQMARLRAEPELLPSAIEEVLRYRSPVQLVFRVTTRGVTLRGRRIPSGSLVLPVIGSANRDRSRFRRPQQFDITRDDERHVAFGHGAHFCIGATLARLEATAALSRLLELRNLRLENSRGWVPRHGLNIHGPAELRVVFDRPRQDGG